MNIKLKDDILTIKLTKEELQKFMVGGLKALIEQNNAIQYWLPNISYSNTDKDNEKNTPNYPNWTYTLTYPCNTDWPWKDKDGHMIGGAQVDDGRKYPCEASDTKNT